MKISWKSFAQRRKLNLQMFNNMTYKNYTEWCTIRSVEPVSKESFDGVQSIVIESISEVPVATNEPTVYDFKALRKLRKSALAKLCQEQNLEFKDSTSKNQLIQLLMSLNNNG